MGMLDRCKRQPKPRGPDDDDEDPEEEIARNLWANFKMFPPKSRFKHHWDRLMVALVMYNTFCIIIVVCFNRYNPYSGLYYYEVATDQTLVVPMVIDYIVDLFFIADICIMFRVTFYDDNNELVVEKRKIALAYMRKPTGFALDAAAVFPFELLGFIMPPHHALMPQLRLFRLLRLTKVAKQINVHSAVIRVSQMLWLFLIFSHIVAAFWWALGISTFNRDAMTFPPGTSWTTRFKLDGCIDELTLRLANNNVAVVDVDASGTLIVGGDANMTSRCSVSSLGIDYMFSLYWALSALIKTPCAIPDTVFEGIFVSIMVVLGAVLFAAILGNVTAMINSFDKSNSQLRDIITTFQRLIGRYHVPPKLQQRIFQYVQVHWATTKGIDNNRILAKLPQAMRGDILEAINADLITGCALFSKVSHECMRLMLSKLKPEVCLPKENLLTPGQMCNEVFILVRGSLHAAPGDDEGRKSKGSKMKAFRALEMTGKFVGMRDPFEKEFRYPFHVSAVKQVQVAALSAKDMLEVFVMDNRNDIEAFCNALEKEFADLAAALNPKGPRESRGSVDQSRGSISGRGSGSKDRSGSVVGESVRRVSSATIEFLGKDEIHHRVGLVEETVRACTHEIKTIKEDLALLPALCEKLGVNPADLADR